MFQASKSARNIAVLGSTGSVGSNTLDVIRQMNGMYRVCSLAAGRNWTGLRRQVEEFKPRKVALEDPAAAGRLKDALGNRCPQVVSGPDALVELVNDEDVDTVVLAVVGASGLRPALETIRLKKRLALANKETLVMAGSLLLELSRQHGTGVLPVDSEHSALFQIMEIGEREDVQRVIITASGGPFRSISTDAMNNVKPEQALNHPTWRMGPKITIDSATMMNKAFEVIEAHWLFDLELEQIEVVIHPQCVVHGMVEYRDGLMLAHMGWPDMKLPILYALTYPNRVPFNLPRLDLTAVGELTFYQPDKDKFPALELGAEVIRRGGTTGAALNAANEIAVNEFLEGKIRFPIIAEVAAEVMARHPYCAAPDLDTIMATDSWSREETRRCLQRYYP